MRAYDVAGMNRLRFVFDNEVRSVGLAADATFADVAEALSGFFQTARPGPSAIGVTMALRRSRLDNLPISLSQRRRPTDVAAR
jgi:hypothetical protein